MKFYNHNRVDEKVQNPNFVKTHFLTKLVQSYRYRFYNADFVFDNQLYKHLRIIYNKSRFSIKNIIVVNFEFINKFIIIISATKTFLLITFHASKIVHLNITNIMTKKYAFRKYRFVIILIIFVLIKQDYEICFDTKYIMNLIDRKFLFEIFLNIVIKKMSTFITMKDIDVNIYSVNKYVRL